MGRGNGGAMEQRSNKVDRQIFLNVKYVDDTIARKIVLLQLRTRYQQRQPFFPSP